MIVTLRSAFVAPATTAITHIKSVTHGSPFLASRVLDDLAVFSIAFENEASAYGYAMLQG